MYEYIQKPVLHSRAMMGYLLDRTDYIQEKFNALPEEIYFSEMLKNI
jgi:hypothetical protein